MNQKDKKAVVDITMVRIKKMGREQAVLLKRILEKGGLFIKSGFEKGIAWAQEHRVLSGVLAAIVLLVGLAHVVAGPSVGVIDVLQLRDQAKIYRLVSEEQEKYEQQWRVRFEAEKKLLAQEDKELAEQRSKMKKAVFKKKVDAFQKKVIAFQEKYQKEYAQIVMASQEAVRQADEQALKAMAQLSEQKGVAVILSKQSVLFADKTVDLTADFIELFNESDFSIKYPNPVKMKLPNQQ